MIPVPSRKIGNRSFPDSRRLYSQPFSATSCPSWFPACSMVIVVMVQFFAQFRNDEFSREACPRSTWTAQDAQRLANVSRGACSGEGGLVGGEHFVSLGRPSLFKAVERRASSGELLGYGWSFVPCFLFQFEDQRQTSLRRRLEGLDGTRPIDRTVVRRKVLILFAMIVVEVHGGDEIAQRRKTFLQAW